MLDSDGYPKPVAEPNLEKLKEILDTILRGRWSSKEDEQHSVYEAALEAIYGKDIWEWFYGDTDAEF